MDLSLSLASFPSSRTLWFKGCTTTSSSTCASPASLLGLSLDRPYIRVCVCSRGKARQRPRHHLQTRTHTHPVFDSRKAGSFVRPSAVSAFVRSSVLEAVAAGGVSHARSRCVCVCIFSRCPKPIRAVAQSSVGKIHISRVERGSRTCPSVCARCLPRIHTEKCFDSSTSDGGSFPALLLQQQQQPRPAVIRISGRLLKRVS